MNRLSPLTCALTLAAAHAPGQQAVPPGFVLDQDTGITIRAGFDVEMLYEVPKSQGSWVALGFDPQGRLMVSDQDDKGVFRVTLPEPGRPLTEIRVASQPRFPFEPIAWGRRTVGGALGFLHAFDALYMTTLRGFYRVRDTDDDDRYDEFTLLKRLHKGWEHSAHSIVETADRTGLLLVSGNHARVPDGVRSLQPEVWAEDSLLPSIPDPQGHAARIRPPGGWICRVAPDGSDWTMIASGLRNPVDLAVNRDGELFTFDSDLEFDVGSPWYRPTRILHVTSASEFGWRTGSAKWPDDFPDGNGTVLAMGPGSPTGIAFGYRAAFPAAYRDLLFVCDWTFGTIFTVALREHGSTYKGTKREFLHGSPLNIAAMRFGPDGHMYFVVGGRRTDSKLYRVRYTGEAAAQAAGAATTTDSTAQTESVDSAGSGIGPERRRENRTLRALRHRLEAFHGIENTDDADSSAAAIRAAWPHLGHPDRSIRYAARIAIEWQDLRSWRQRVFSETDARTAIHAILALCRHGDSSARSPVLDKLGALPFATLPTEDRLAMLRAYSLCLIRLGHPTEAEAARIIAQLDPQYPSAPSATATDRDAERLNAELCRLLCFLDAPSVVAKTLALMERTETETLAYDKAMLARHEYGKPILESMANTPNRQNIHYAYSLRRVQSGWTLDRRKDYFTWLNDTLQKSGGKSFAGYIRAIRDDAIRHLTKEDASAVSWLLGDIDTIDLGKLPRPAGPPGLWTLESALPLFERELRSRDFRNGERMFSAGQCIACHRFRGSGGYAGPDLGSVGKRYSVRDILIAILQPSESISEQYQASHVTLTDGSQLYGRIIFEKDGQLALAANPFDLGQLTKTPTDRVARIEPSAVSMMPPSTVALMNADELADLIAYLISGGDKKHAAFRRPK